MKQYQLLATLRNDPQALIVAQSDGTVGIQLGPIVETSKRPCSPGTFRSPPGYHR